VFDQLDLILTELTDRERKKDTPLGNETPEKMLGSLGKANSCAYVL